MQKYALYFAFIALLMIGGTTVNAEIPRLITYQGRLTDNVGIPVTDGSYTVNFIIYDDSTFGSQLWFEGHVVETINGLFEVQLGLHTSLDEELFIDHADLFIAVQLSGQPEMSPRIRMTSSAFCYQAFHADHADVASAATVGGGWRDDGAAVRLDNSADNVGIGTSTPSVKLDVVGDANIAGKTTFGTGHTSSGNHAAIGGGTGSTVSGDGAVISGGDANTASGELATIGGGQGHWAGGDFSTVAGGAVNNSYGRFSTIAGGGPNDPGNPLTGNRAAGDYSAIGGGGNNQAGDENLEQYEIEYATVGGGESNYASRDHSTVSGGENNIARAHTATVSGGFSNVAEHGYATVGGGANNCASGQGSTVGGGQSCLARGDWSVVAGGGGAGADSNSALGTGAVISGGYTNVASGGLCTIGGGSHNTADSSYSTVSGGVVNSAKGNSATVSGGSHNTALELYATVSGGYRNTASSEAAVVGGGQYCYARGNHSVVAGGGGVIEADSNSAVGDCSVISGGGHNLAGGLGSVIGGGAANQSLGLASVISGGRFNTASGDGSVVSGGQYNHAEGNFSFAAGYRARALHHGTFVWADSTDADFQSTHKNQFLIRASGGVGVGTVSPGAMLDVADDDRALRLRAGNGQAEFTDNQIMLSYNGTVNYTHAIKSRHSGSNSALNAIDFFVWDPAVDAVTDVGTKHVMTIDGEGVGEVGIGTDDPQHTLDVRGEIGNNGTVYHSDRRWKKEISPLSNALERIQQLRGVSYEWRRDEFPDMNFSQGRHIGLIAQEVEDVLPELVVTDSDGYKSVAYANLVAVLIEAVKEQQNQIADQQEQITQLIAELEKLKSALPMSQR